MIDTLDLTRHAVFEASAGTGKTHTIGQLVLRLLSQQQCRLEELLIVTFTDKATGELKDRLRRELETAVDRNPELAPVLQPQLDQFDRASISTIHGFCARVLQEHASDLGQDFHADMVQDNLLRRDILREVQRKDWPAHFGERLPTALAESGYHREKDTGWDKTVDSILARYRPECDHVLLPADDDPNAPLAHALVAFTVRRTRERLRDAKQQRGQMSFDDVIERVDFGLDPARNPRASVVIDGLRRQYTFAIVDEFQDTDRLQWAIFRRLFLEGGTSRLIVVGDPKQAIYGFRGADLPTYLRAVAEMESVHGADVKRLGINWRSSPAIIAGLNCFFGDGVFFPPERSLTYTAVAPPPPELRKASLVSDGSGRPAITIVDVDGEPSAAIARQAYAGFAAREIRRMLHGDHGEPTLTIEDRRGTRPLRANDICILVFAHTDAKVFAAALARQRIPFSRYKSGSVRETPEARDIRLVLKALAQPDRDDSFTRALMTMFFRVPPHDLMAAGALPAEHPARILFARWLALADARQWSALFTSMLEDTGVLFRDRESGEYDRRLANLKLLFGQLQDAAYRSNLDLYELVEIFTTIEVEDEADDDYPPRETDEPRVQIMTIHAAKGLEFPVVFLGGGFTTSRFKELAYRDDHGRLVFDLPFLAVKKHDKNDTRPQRMKDDKSDENRRLLYVALTRAQFKLYLPLMDKKKQAESSAIVTLVTPALVASGLDGHADLAIRVSPSDNDGPMSMKAVIAVAEPLAPLSVEPLFPEFDPTIIGRRTFVQSFTAMHKQQKKERDAFGERRDRIDETPELTTEVNDPFRGATFGELVHEIFERVDFGEIAAANSEGDLGNGVVGRLIAEETSRFLPRLVTRAPDERLTAECRRLLQNMVWHALRTPLPHLGARLCDLAPVDCLRELEFLYPTAVRSSESPVLMKGFMDLVFRWGDRVYLLDWKTNVLPSYDQPGLESGMAEAGYHLQYELYLEALKRWLKGSANRLGGVYYVFLRGLAGGQGIYFVPPK